LALVLDRDVGRFTIVIHVSLSETFRDRGVAECICAKGGFNVLVDVDGAQALLAEIEAD
jgi:hypothetical protein